MSRDCIQTQERAQSRDLCSFHILKSYLELCKLSFCENKRERWFLQGFAEQLRHSQRRKTTPSGVELSSSMSKAWVPSQAPGEIHRSDRDLKSVWPPWLRITLALTLGVQIPGDRIHRQGIQLLGGAKPSSSSAGFACLTATLLRHHTV